MVTKPSFYYKPKSAAKQAVNSFHIKSGVDDLGIFFNIYFLCLGWVLKIFLNMSVTSSLNKK